MAARLPDGERIYAIGDIHGRLDLFERLVASIRADNESRGAAKVRLILLGDIVDRGPDSAPLTARCMDLTRKSDRFIVLKGNHEAMMVDAIRGNFVALDLWLNHGGDAALRSFGVDAPLVAAGSSPELLRAARECVPADVLAWASALPLTRRAGDYLFVHAGIRPGVALDSQQIEDLIWIRKDFLESDADHAFTVVHGHSVTDEGVVTRPNRIGIDTGAYRTGVLTALGLEADRRWTVATTAPADEPDAAMPLPGQDMA